MCEKEGLFETKTSLVKTNLIYYTTNFINKFMDQRPLLAKALQHLGRLILATPLVL